MSAYSQATIKKLLKRADTAPTDDARGEAFEELVCYLFRMVPGIPTIKRNPLSIFRSEELDLVLWNEHHARGLKFFSTVIPVECKNCMHPISGTDVEWFIMKLRRRALDFGILVAAEGITGDPAKLTGAHDIVSSALNEGIRMIIITRQEIEHLTSSEELVQLIKEKVCELIIRRTALP